MSYNSDFDVRLATLGALGGDTAKTYDSVYAIDLAILEAIEQGGGGGGMTYDQIKTLLASSGVTEIVVNGDGDSITLDYDLLAQIGEFDYSKVQSGLTHTGVTDILVLDGSGNTIDMNYNLLSQIGQGGGDYMVVEGIDALSGITNPKDGMVVYVGEVTKQEQAVVVTADWYNGVSESFHLDLDYSGVTKTIHLNSNGSNINIENGYWLRNGDGWFWNIYDNRSELPQGFAFYTGMAGFLQSNVDGAEYNEHGEYSNTLYIYPYNGILPTATFRQEDFENVNIVSTGISTETISITYPIIGTYKYYADVQQWLPFEVNWDTMDYEQKQDVLNKGAQYRKPLSCFRTNDNYGVSVRKYDAFYNGYYDYEENPRVNQIAFTTKTYRNPSTDICFLQFNCEWDDGSQRWNIDGINDNNMPDRNSVNNMIRGFVSTEDSNNTYDGIYYGGLYSAAVNGTYSGVTISTTIPIDSTITSDWNYQGTASVSVRGRNSREVDVSELGHVFTHSIGNISASTNAEWIVFDYCNTWNDDENKNITAIMAMKVEDNGNDTFTLSIFITNDNWQEGDNPDDHHWWVDEHWGRTDECEFRYNSDRGYTWTVTEHQTVTFAPHLYTQIRETILNKQDVRMVYKLL